MGVQRKGGREREKVAESRRRGGEREMEFGRWERKREGGKGYVVESRRKEATCRRERDGVVCKVGFEGSEEQRRG